MAQGSPTVDLETFTNYVGTGTAQPPPGLTPGGHEAKKKRQAMEREAAARPDGREDDAHHLQRPLREQVLEPARTDTGRSTRS